MTIKEAYEKYKWLDDITISPNSDGDNPTIDLWQAIKEEVEKVERLEDAINSASPLKLVVTSDMDGASAYEKRLLDVLNIFS